MINFLFLIQLLIIFIIFCLYIFLQITIIGRLQVHALKFPKYNRGNVDFELLVNDQTSVETFGSYELKQTSDDVVQEMSITETYEAIGSTISKFYITVLFLKYFIQRR